MDFHNMRRMRRGVAAVLALTAPVPALLVLGAWFMFAPVRAAAPLQLLGGLALLSAAYAALVGWWMGGAIE